MSELPVIAVRFALYTDLMVLAGLAAFPLYAMTAEERASGLLRLRAPAIALSAAALLLSGFGMVALIASMTGTSLTGIDGETARSIVTETAIGTAWIARMIAMLAALGLALKVDQGRWPVRSGLVLCSAAALATLVWTGHAGATEGWQGTIHRGADAVHLWAAAVWIGGIAAFAWLLFSPVERLGQAGLVMANRALEQFSRVGTIAVALIVATGVVNSLILLGLPEPDRMFTSLYGRLLLAKLVLLAAMLTSAAMNRWRLVPALSVAIASGDARTAIGGLRISLITEGSTALGILALVAWLGMLEPPA